MPPRPRPRHAVLLVAAVGMVVAACSGAPANPTPQALTARPVGPSPGTTPTAPTPSPAETAEPSPSPSPSPTEREPTATDQARFVAAYAPEGARDLEHVAVDLDADGRPELLFAYVGGEAAHVDVAWWLGTAYEIMFRGEGGPAERIDELRVGDLNGDGTTELAVTQSVGSSGQSLSLWRARPPESYTLEPLVARGGCADGLNTYGVVGARMEDGDRDGSEEIYATCDDSPLPVAAWSTDVYEWRDGAYRFERSEHPGE